jgi:hypothetical protein
VASFRCQRYVRERLIDEADFSALETKFAEKFRPLLSATKSLSFRDPSIRQTDERRVEIGPIIRKLNPALPQRLAPSKCRGYARVSLEKDSMLTLSIRAGKLLQRPHQKNLGWRYAGVYADE